MLRKDNVAATNISVVEKPRQKLIFKILFCANIVVILATLMIAVSDNRAEINAGNESLVSVLLLAAISRAIPYWLTLLVLNVWGIFLYRSLRILFIVISILLAIFITISFLVVFQFATYGI